jgi:hypothetical protein
MFIPIILGSDKTTVSIAKGQNNYYSLYLSIGNVHNNVHCAHRNALVLIGFLALPKGKLLSMTLYSSLFMVTADRTCSADPKFRKFRRQLFHSSLSSILQSLKHGMLNPEVLRCPDGHFRRCIFGLGPYIADYQEQVLLSCIVQGWCPRYKPTISSVSFADFSFTLLDAQHPRPT